MALRVLIADDDPIIRKLFRLMLESTGDFEIVGEAEHGGEAVELAEALGPQVVLMDLLMPQMGGIAATRRITEGESAVKVLILTPYEPDEYVFEALRAGASGFLVKNVSARELAGAIEVVLAGESLVASAITCRLIGLMAGDRQQNSPATLAPLMGRELEILELIAKGLSNAEIADKLVIAETIVHTHVDHVLMKLDLRDRVQAAMYAYETGIVRPPN